MSLICWQDKSNIQLRFNDIRIYTQLYYFTLAVTTTYLLQFDSTRRKKQRILHWHTSNVGPVLEPSVKIDPLITLTGRERRSSEHK